MKSSAGELDARGGGARLGDLGERRLLVVGRRLHGGDEVRNELGAPLEIGVEIGPLLLADLVLLDERVVLLTAGHGEDPRDDEEEELDHAENARKLETLSVMSRRP